MSLSADLESVAASATTFAAPGEELGGVVAVETLGRRVYLCAFEGVARAWVAVDDNGHRLHDRALVRSAVSIAALCELAEESAGGGHR